MYKVIIKYNEEKTRTVFTSDDKKEAESEAAFLQNMLGNDLLSVSCFEEPKLAEMCRDYDRN